MPRLTIITGQKDSGKSTVFLQRYRLARHGVGIFSCKKILAGRVWGYDLVLLPQEEQIPPFALLSEQTPTDVPGLRHGMFWFSSVAFWQAIDSMLHSSSDTYWIDEVGKIEIDNKGFAPLLHDAIAKGKHLILTVRENHVDRLLQTFGFSSYTIETIKVKSSDNRASV